MQDTRLSVKEVTVINRSLRRGARPATKMTQNGATNRVSEEVGYFSLLQEKYGSFPAVIFTLEFFRQRRDEGWCQWKHRPAGLVSQWPHSFGQSEWAVTDGCEVYTSQTCHFMCLQWTLTTAVRKCARGNKMLRLQSANFMWNVFNLKFKWFFWTFNHLCTMYKADNTQLKFFLLALMDILTFIVVLRIGVALIVMVHGGATRCVYRIKHKNMLLSNNL